MKQYSSVRWSLSACCRYVSRRQARLRRNNFSRLLQGAILTFAYNTFFLLTSHLSHCRTSIYQPATVISVTKTLYLVRLLRNRLTMSDFLNADYQFLNTLHNALAHRSAYSRELCRFPGALQLIPGDVE